MKRKQITQIVLLLIILAQQLFSQTSKIDSLREGISKSAYEHPTAKQLNLLALEYITLGQYDSARQIATRAKELSDKIIAQSNNVEERPAKETKIKSLSILGTIFSDKGNYADAIKLNLEALNMAEAIDDKRGMGQCYGSVGNIYLAQNNNKAALINYELCLKMFEQIKDERCIAGSYINLGLINQNMRNFTEALNYYRLAIAINTKAKDYYILKSAYNNSADVYQALGNFDEAIKHNLLALKLREDQKDLMGVSMSNGNLGALYLEQALSERTEVSKKAGLLKASESYLQKAIAMSKNLGDKEGLKENYENLSKLYSYLHNEEKAYAFYKLFILYKDSLFGEENSKRIVETQMQYDFNKKDAIAKAEQEKKDLFAEDEKQKQKLIIAAIISGLILVSIIAMVILRNLIENKRKNKIITEQKELVEKQKELVVEKQQEILDSIYYARRIQKALITSEHYIEKQLDRLKSIR